MAAWMSRGPVFIKDACRMKERLESLSPHPLQPPGCVGGSEHDATTGRRAWPAGGFNGKRTGVNAMIRRTASDLRIVAERRLYRAGAPFARVRGNTTTFGVVRATITLTMTMLLTSSSNPTSAQYCNTPPSSQSGWVGNRMQVRRERQQLLIQAGANTTHRP